MASVYRNGHFTIAATHARNGSGGLFRSTADVEVRAVEVESPSGRPYPLNAPTWSWASVATEATFWAFLWSKDKLRIDPRWPFRHFSTVVRCKVQPAAVDEYGSVAHGSLTISGLAMEGVLELNSIDPRTPHLRVYYIVFPHVRKRIDPDYALARDEAGNKSSMSEDEQHSPLVDRWPELNLPRLEGITFPSWLL
ncbi:hypothetical protein BJY04DRAFT_224385 [Aspergillus karnatakaensis]|uniref:uncharacterized protein n=1 Tax=Aspergillus karnatakaensis TaxID=1810916 RepID=UPI003CCD85BE